MNTLTEELAEVLIAQQGTNIVIPNTYDYIDESAFEEKQLTSVVVPDSVTAIGDYAFIFNELTSAILGTNLTSIGTQAFAGNNLTSISIPDSVTTIGPWAFDDNRLNSVDLGGRVEIISHDAFKDNLLSDIEIPDSVIYIGEDAFSGNRIKSVTIPDSVVFIGDDAFGDGDYGDDYLESVIIPKNSSLDLSVFPDGVEIIRGDSSTTPEPIDEEEIPDEGDVNEGSPDEDVIDDDLVKKLKSLWRLSDTKTRKNIITYELLESGYFSRDCEYVIVGTQKKDKITGTSKHEILSGRDGKDTLKGNRGADGFVFEKPLEFGKKKADEILDFNQSEGDWILLDSEIYFLDWYEIKNVESKKAANKAADGGDLIIYNEKKGHLYYNENGDTEGWGDGGLFAKFKGAPQLTVDDFSTF